jgi:hypothetical protein
MKQSQAISLILKKSLTPRVAPLEKSPQASAKDEGKERGYCREQQRGLRRRQN